MAKNIIEINVGPDTNVNGFDLPGGKLLQAIVAALTEPNLRLLQVAHTHVIHLTFEGPATEDDYEAAWQHCRAMKLRLLRGSDPNKVHIES